MSQSATPRNVLFLTWFNEVHTHIALQTSKRKVWVWLEQTARMTFFCFGFFYYFFKFCQKSWNFFFCLSLFCYFWFGEKIQKHWCAPVLSCYFLPSRSHSLCSRLRGLCHGNWQGSSNLGKQGGKQRFFSLWFLGSLSARHTELCVSSQETQETASSKKYINFYSSFCPSMSDNKLLYNASVLLMERINN